MMLTNVRYFTTGVIPKVCVIGAGPAGFYATQQLLKLSKNVRVDLIERLPVPFGLVRFGVAPDHPEVKNVINTFDKVARNPRVNFIGNVNVGQDVSINQLREMYNVVLLSYGAEEDKALGIPGENLNNVISGRRFVGWYNGVPQDKDLSIDLDVEHAVVLGQGNVAMDIARILLTPIDKLKNTDITSYALEHLSRSRVRRVSLIGRRGPLQAAFTIAELRELTKLEGCRTRWRSDDFHGIQEIVPTLQRPKKRLTELMLKSLNESLITTEADFKIFNPIFFRSPIEFLGSNKIENVKLSINKLVGDELLKQTAKSTDNYEIIPCNLAFRSIGYKSVQIDKSVAFDKKLGRVCNVDGRVDDDIYAAGWVATGPIGVILSTMTNAFQVATTIAKQNMENVNKPGFNMLTKILDKKGIQTVSYADWEKIDVVEREQGKKLNKPREKIVDVNEMLKITSK